MNRRNFFKALGLSTSASALSACGMDSNRYYTPIEQILPYVVKPEQVTPGTPTFFATALTHGPDAHPVLAKHRDGRVIHVAANKEAPFPPAVPKSALFELQKHYSPDRHKAPSANGQAVSWEDGLNQVVTAVQRAKNTGKKVAWLGQYRSGSLAKLVADLCDTTVFWEPLGYEAEANAAEALFGSRTLPRYDLSSATYVLSFGADFLNHWGGARTASQFAEARSHAHGGHVARFALVSPYRDQTGANADDWHAVTPGSEVLVARAVAGLVAKKTGYSGPALAALGSVEPSVAATAAGIEVNVLTGIADAFASGKGIALPGGAAGASQAASELAAATFLLNIIGGAAPDRFSARGYAGTVSNTADLEALLADLNGGKISVLLIDDVNPVHALPNVAVADAIKKAELSVAFSSHPDETTAAAKLLLPSSDVFEDWGDDTPFAGMTLLRQPSMSPLNDTRSIGDVLLAAAKALGLATQATWRDYLLARWANGAYQKLVVEPSGSQAAATEGVSATTPENPTANETTRGFQDWFNTHLAKGYVQTASARNKVAPAVTGSIPWGASVAPRGTGDYYLHIAPHCHLRDGRFANQPWAQELPDPMTGHVWGSWVEVHPDTAASLRVGDNDALTLTGTGGSVTVGVEVTKSVRPDTLAVQFGQGHTANGRYANEVGANVAALLELAKDPQGAIAWQGSKVSAATAGRADTVNTFSISSDTDEGRNFAVHVNAGQFEAKGDAPSNHPGELTGIHHLELDKRLTDAGVIDFYGLTQHPTYRFGMTVDTDTCNGCGACSVACSAENNIPIVGKQKVAEGREMSWIRINRYFKGDEVHFVPMMCQQCGHAPCESVCPVLATYHNLDGLNAMIYNRCVGTRYCANACPYSARKFNYHSYVWPEPFGLLLNPDVMVRTMGVMEKCTFCVQRIRQVKSAYKDAESFTAVVPDAALRQLPACAEACPTQAITFGNLNDEKSGPSTYRKSARHYEPLADLNVFPAINYLAKVSFHAPEAGHHGGGGGGAHGATEDHGKADDHGAGDKSHPEPADDGHH